MLAIFVDRYVRGSGRGAAVLRTAFVSMLARGFSIVSSLVTVPIVLHHVGTERYGVWMAAISLATWFTMADGGVTKDLIAQVAQAHGANDRTRIRILVASALAMMVAFASLFFAAVLIGVRLVDWAWVFNLSDPALAGEAAGVVTIICACFALSFPATVVREARLGLLQGGAVNAWDLFGSVLGFAGLVMAVSLGYGLMIIAAVWSGAPALARTVGALVFLWGEGRDLVPSWRDVRPKVCRSLLGGGSAFMIYTLALALSVQSDQILIAHFLGAKAVAGYSVVQRLFNQPPVLVTLFLAAQWPAYGEALGRGDFDWIRRHFRQTLIGFMIAGTILCGLLGYFCQDILRVWVGGAIVASPTLVTAMAIYAVVAIIANVLTFFFMSLQLYRPLIFTQVAMIAVNLPLTIFLLPRIGSSGAIIGTTAGYLFALVLPGLVMLRSIFMNLPALKVRTPAASDAPQASPARPGAAA